MRAAVYTRYGRPDALRLRDVPKPTPSAGEVLIRVRAASINSWDWDLVRGRPYIVRIGGLRRPRFPILGADVAGTVEAVGDGVARFQPGDAVYGDISGSGWGGFAEYVCAREEVLARKPASLSFAEAAAVPQAGVLALQGLRNKRPLQPGDHLLINGAGGGVGTFALQIARSLGAAITAVDKPGKLEALRAHGAERVIDYTRADFTRSGQTYDLILDVVAHRSVFDYRRALRPGGAFVMVGGATGRILQVATVGTLLSRIGDRKLGILVHRPNSTDLDALTELIEAGVARPCIDRQFRLAEIVDAFRYYGRGDFIGKVVIIVANDDATGG